MGVSNIRDDEIDAARARDRHAKRGQAISAANKATGNVAFDGALMHWPEPRALPDAKLAPVAQFDYDLLPEQLYSWAVDIAERMQCPPDFVGVTIMAALGAVVGRRVAVRPKEHDDWQEHPNLWAMVVGRPGMLKSPAMRAALAPLHALDARFDVHHADEMARWETENVINRARRKAEDKRVEKLLAKDPKAIIEPNVFNDEQAPGRRRLIVNDTTVEKLGEILRDNPHGVAIYRDELVGLFRSLEREGQEGARSFYLSAWSGDEPYVWDRIGRGRVSVPAVCLSVIGSTQPGRLADYLHDATSGGANDDGLMQRFSMLVWPDAPEGEWSNVDRKPDTEAKRAAYSVFDRLMIALAVEDWHAEYPFDHDGEPYETQAPFLRLDDEAQAVFLEWRRALENEIRGGVLHESIEAHLTKYRKLVPGLALLCHLVDVGRGPIGAASMRRAVAWAAYLRTHAERAYGMCLVTPLDRARALLDRIRKGSLSGEPFALKRLYDAGWSRLGTRAEAQQAVDVLVEHGYLIVAEAGGKSESETGGRPREPRYAVNPKAMPGSD